MKLLGFFKSKQELVEENKKLKRQLASAEKVMEVDRKRFVALVNAIKSKCPSFWYQDKDEYGMAIYGIEDITLSDIKKKIEQKKNLHELLCNYVQHCDGEELSSIIMANKDLYVFEPREKLE